MFGGPSFGKALRCQIRSSIELSSFPMKIKDGGTCLVHDNDEAGYQIPCDSRGNSVLAGDSGFNNNGHFTVKGIELFLIE